VISLPASDTAGSPHTQADDVEVGGQRGREALDRLRNVVGRVESSWRPASAEEGFEIVRRRLFEPMSDPAQFKDRDAVRFCETLDHGPQPAAGLPMVVYTPPLESAINTARRFLYGNTVSSEPGAALPWREAASSCRRFSSE
jgi:hypothetical protein